VCFAGPIERRQPPTTVSRRSLSSSVPAPAAGTVALPAARHRHLTAAAAADTSGRGGLDVDVKSQHLPARDHLPTPAAVRAIFDVSQPAHIRSIDTLSAFKCHLKFHLCQSAFTV